MSEFDYWLFLAGFVGGYFGAMALRALSRVIRFRR